jgi:ABC-2 type transport system ATP-binding protein
MEVLVEADRLRKTFGHIVAVDEISLKVAKGEVLGFLGPNGAGKSTTMKMLTGFLEPDAGTAKIRGISVSERPKEAKALIGYLPEGAPAYGDMSAGAFLRFIAEIRGRKGETGCRRRRADRSGARGRAADRDALQRIQASRGSRPSHSS